MDLADEEVHLVLSVDEDRLLDQQRHKSPSIASHRQLAWMLAVVVVDAVASEGKAVEVEG